MNPEGCSDRARPDWALQSPNERFFDFIALEADRFDILFEHMQKLGLNFVAININENRHFFIFPQRVTMKKIAESGFPFHGQSPVVLTAHYDRVADSPGANDNSVAVFLLLKAALVLTAQNASQWIIIFTDKEELKSGEGIQEQGSFTLAEKLRDWGLSKARIFNFDACGTGDTFVFSSTTDYLLNKNQKPGFTNARQTMRLLREKAIATTRRLNLSNVLLAPIPFSDDAGFLRGGIPAQTITMLPAGEAAPYASLLQNHPDFIDMIITAPIKTASAHYPVPDTWLCINSHLDSHLRLTPEHYEGIVRLAVGLCS